MVNIKIFKSLIVSFTGKGGINIVFSSMKISKVDLMLEFSRYLPWKEKRRRIESDIAVDFFWKPLWIQKIYDIA